MDGLQIYTILASTLIPKPLNVAKSQKSIILLKRQKNTDIFFKKLKKIIDIYKIIIF